MKKIIITTLSVVLPALALLIFLHPEVTQVRAESTANSQLGLYYVMVTPDSYYKIQGSSVMFTGNHFYPYEIVTIQTNGSIIGTIQADSNGNFTTGWMTVMNTSGRENFTFTGTTSQIPFSVGISVGGNQPWLTLSSYYEGVGSPLTITGHGFGSRELVTVTFSGMTIGTAHADYRGTFILNTIVPYDGPGTQIITAYGLNTGGKVQATFSQSF